MAKTIKRTPRLFQGKKKRYVRLHGKKHTLPADKSKKEHLNIIINNFTAQSKPRRRRASGPRARAITTLNGGLPGNLAANVLGDVNTKYAKLSDEMQKKQLQYLTKIQQLEGKQGQLEGNLNTGIQGLQNQIAALPAPAPPPPPPQPQIAAPPQQLAIEEPKVKIKKLPAPGKYKVVDEHGKKFTVNKAEVQGLEKKAKEAEQHKQALEQQRQQAAQHDLQAKIQRVKDQAKHTVLQTAAQKYGIATREGRRQKSGDELVDELEITSPDFLNVVAGLPHNASKNTIDDAIRALYTPAAPAPALAPVGGPPPDQQPGGGMDDELAQKGLYGSQILEIMHKEGINERKGFMGVIAADQIPQLAARIPKGARRISFIMNLDPANKPGTHWVAVYIDSTHDRSLNYYDSFGRDPSTQFMKDINYIIDKMEPVYHPI